MSDLIDRRKALDGLEYEMKYGAEIDRCGLDTAYDIIENIPSAEPKRKWIPVTEALPEKYKQVLVTTIDGAVRLTARTDVTYWLGIGRGNVEAWMPLPEPWRGE